MSTQSHLYLNQYVTIEGKVSDTYNSGEICFLNFEPNYKKYFSAVIFESEFDKFSKSPDKLYDGKKIRVTGSLISHNQKPEIVIADPSQIEIIE